MNALSGGGAEVSSLPAHLPIRNRPSKITTIIVIARPIALLPFQGVQYDRSAGKLHLVAIDAIFDGVSGIGGWSAEMHYGAVSLLSGILCFGALGCSLEPSQNQTSPTRAAAAQTPLPAHPEITLRAEPISNRDVRFTVTTNLPLPIEVMASVSLANQRPEATWIGLDQRVTLAQPTTTFILDTSRAHRPLPSGEYEAEVSFYPRWGATGNPAAQRASEIRAVQTLALTASGTSRADAERRNDLQRWVMENVIMHTPWDERVFVARLGRYDKTQAELSHLHDAYYFPAADMTLIVNRLLGEVTIWRMGRASR